MSKLEDMNLDFDLQTDEEELTEEEFEEYEEGEYYEDEALDDEDLGEDEGDFFDEPDDFTEEEAPEEEVQMEEPKQPVRKAAPVKTAAPAAPSDPVTRRNPKKNPFSGPVVVLGLILILLVGAVLGTMYYMDSVEKQKEEELTRQNQEALAKAQSEAAQREQELQARLTEEYAAGTGAGRRQTLDEIRQGIENGQSVAAVLRSLYTDQLVVGSGGTYRFVPINDDLKKNDYHMENLITLESGELQYMTGGKVSSYKGIDVSKFQGKIDWAKVAADGVTFAFIRVGYRGYGESGVLVEDTTAKDNLQGANDAGIKTGAYFYTQATTEAEVAEEVEMFLDLIRPYRIDLPVVIDVERVSAANARMNQLDAQTRTTLVKSFCDRVAAAGYRPMIYHNLEMGAVMLDVAQLEDYDKWFAYYNKDFYYPYDYKIWQYSDKGRVSGISGDVDLDIAFEALWD